MKKRKFPEAVRRFFNNEKSMYTGTKNSDSIGRHQRDKNNVGISNIILYPTKNCFSKKLTPKGNYFYPAKVSFDNKGNKIYTPTKK